MELLWTVGTVKLISLLGRLIRKLSVNLTTPIIGPWICLCNSGRTFCLPLENRWRYLYIDQAHNWVNLMQVARNPHFGPIYLYYNLESTKMCSKAPVLRVCKNINVHFNYSVSKSHSIGSAWLSMCTALNEPIEFKEHGHDGWQSCSQKLHLLRMATQDKVVVQMNAKKSKGLKHSPGSNWQLPINIFLLLPYLALTLVRH